MNEISNYLSFSSYFPLEALVPRKPDYPDSQHLTYFLLTYFCTLHFFSAWPLVILPNFTIHNRAFQFLTTRKKESFNIIDFNS